MAISIEGASANASKATSFAKVVGFMVGSIAVSPIATVGALAIIATKTKGLWVKTNTLEKLKARETQITANACSPASKEEAIKELKKLHYEIEVTENKIEKRKETLTTALLTLIPFFGVSAAASYLKTKLPNAGKTDSSLEVLTNKISSGKQEFARGYLFPAAYGSKDEAIALEAKVNENLYLFDGKPTTVKVERAPGLSTDLTFYYMPKAGDSDPTAPTIVLFHGNAQSPKEMATLAGYYQDKGMNVVLASMGGYPPNSTDGIKTTETSTYQDVNAIMKWLKEENKVTEVGVHGFSIGGALAFAAADMHSDVVKFVVAERTFTSGPDAGGNLIKNSDIHIPASVARGAIAAALPAGKTVYGVTGTDGKPYKTDGLNNLAKAESLQKKETPIPVYTIQGTHDDMMGKKPVNNSDKEQPKTYQTGMGQEIAKACYGDENQNCLRLPVGHCDALELEKFNENDPEKRNVSEVNTFLEGALDNFEKRKAISSGEAQGFLNFL